MPKTAGKKGTFVVLEGIDGAGTTSQTQRLFDSLQERGIPVHRTCEPSTGPIGKLLREFLSKTHGLSDATTLGLLYAADRSDHLQREVLPKLAEGYVVISDRYTLSSLAYQGEDKGRDWVAILNQRARPPDCTYFLRVDPKVAAERREEDGREEELFDKLETQLRVARNYETVIAERTELERIECMDGHQSKDAIAQLLLESVLELV